MTDSVFEIAFRPIVVDDAPNLVRWQRDPEVAVWWGDNEKSDAELLAKWQKRADETDPEHDRHTDHFVVVVNDEDIGCIQGYELRHYPQDYEERGVPNSGGLDLFIGEPKWRDKGVGTEIVRKFIDEVVFAYPEVEFCTIDPEPRNKRAIRTYEKVGFVYFKTYYSEVNKMDCYLMKLNKADFNREGTS